jgi:hypothetical protein
MPPHLMSHVFASVFAALHFSGVSPEMAAEMAKKVVAEVASMVDGHTASPVVPHHTPASGAPVVDDEA